MLRCCICRQAVDRWLPHPLIDQRSEFMKLMDTIGSDLSVYQCPECGCNDRDRHLWLYLSAVGVLQDVRGTCVLHLAPEAHLEQLIAALQPAEYVRGDLHPLREGHVEIDVERLPFADARFDLIICNHVLEHVASPQRALAELHRCLRPASLLIAQTPYSPRLKQTFELNEPVTAEFAKLFYGQEDHVRLFGADIVQYFHAAGFMGELLEHDTLLAGLDPKDHGCNRREPLFAFWKPPAPGSEPRREGAAP